MIAEVIVATNLERSLDYACGDFVLQVGSIVSVALNGRLVLGVVKALKNESTFAKLKVVNNAYDLVLPLKHIKFLEAVSNYNMAPFGNILKMSLPSDIKYYLASQLEKLEKRAEKLIPAAKHVNKIELSGEQIKVFNDLLAASQKFGVHVLHGVTGSGKTEVFLALAEEVMKQGKQVLILMPEIFLSTQMQERFLDRVVEPIYIWHSSVTANRKQLTYQHILNGKAKFVMGARSALMLPFKNIGLIVVDEEHDTSYKQEEGICYNARDMAIVRGKVENIPVLLASATPSIETEYNIREGKFERHLLESRYKGAALPKINIVKSEGELLSSSVKNAIESVLARGKQALIYLNKRGYVPITYCKNCSSKQVCPNCDFNLVLHREEKKLRCHHCAYSVELAKGCYKCHEKDMLTHYGYGVERIAEDIDAMFEGRNVFTISSDHMTVSNKLDVLARIHDCDILIGTQVISKGFDFPRLELVVILDMESNFVSGNIRAHEKTYQMIQQVSGRAGRRSDSGEFIIQTNSPDSEFLQYLRTARYEDFIIDELETRKLAQMPPYRRLVHIVFSSKDHRRLLGVINSVKRHIYDSDEIRIMGPMPSPLFYLKNRFRYRMIVTAERNVNIQKFLTDFLAQFDIPKAIKVKIDVDAISLH